jgi:hypothetical protein
MGKWRHSRRPKWTVERIWTRKQLIKRDGMICGICKEPIAKLADITFDHVVPKSKGGSDKLENLRLAHEFCNTQRGSGFFEPTHQDNMQLIGLQLQEAGVAFIEAKGHHAHGKSSITEVVCSTPEDTDRANAWLKKNGHEPCARTATQKEIDDNKKVCL